MTLHRDKNGTKKPDSCNISRLVIKKCQQTLDNVAVKPPFVAFTYKWNSALWKKFDILENILKLDEKTDTTFMPTC